MLIFVLDEQLVCYRRKTVCKPPFLGILSYIFEYYIYHIYLQRYLQENLGPPLSNQLTSILNYAIVNGDISVQKKYVIIFD